MDNGRKPGVIMKQTILGGLAISALLIAAPLSTAFAADMAVKAPLPAAPVAGPDWTGVYFDVGIGWQRDRFDWTYTNFIPAQIPFSMSESQGSITGHIGYQQQFGWLVVGGEVGAFKSIKGNPATVVAAGGAAVSGPCANVTGFSCQASIGSTSLAGGKVGVDWGNWLFYGVGGAAFNSSIATNLVNPAGIVADTGAQQNKTGWYLGGGVDYMLVRTNFGDLIGGVEYEHVDLGTATECSVPLGGGVATGCPGTVAASARQISAKEDAVWAKLTLKFDPFSH